MHGRGAVAELFRLMPGIDRWQDFYAEQLSYYDWTDIGVSSSIARKHPTGVGADSYLITPGNVDSYIESTPATYPAQTFWRWYARFDSTGQDPRFYYEMLWKVGAPWLGFVTVVGDKIQFWCWDNQRVPGPDFVLKAETTYSRGFLPDTWYEFKMWLIIDPVAGELHVYVDGEDVLTFSGKTSIDIGSAVLPDRVRLTGKVYHLQYFSNIAVTDSTGTNNVGAIPSSLSIRTFPDASGSFTAWTAVPTAPNWDCVNSESDTADFVESGVAGQEDTYNLAAMPSSTFFTGVLSVRQYVRAINSGAPPANVYLEGRISSVTYPGTVFTTSGSWNLFGRSWPGHPGTGASWTLVNIGTNFQIGVKSEV